MLLPRTSGVLFCTDAASMGTNVTQLCIGVSLGIDSCCSFLNHPPNIKVCRRRDGSWYRCLEESGEKQETRASSSQWHQRSRASEVLHISHQILRPSNIPSNLLSHKFSVSPQEREEFNCVKTLFSSQKCINHGIYETFTISRPFGAQFFIFLISKENTP